MNELLLTEITGSPSALGRVRWQLGRALRAARYEFRELWNSDTVAVKLVGVFVMFGLAGVFWDLPGSYGWENDGAAPRDWFGGIVHNFTPGQGHRYPLFHYLMLGCLVSPVLLIDVLVTTFTGADVQEVVVSTPSMTVIALVSKFVNLAMMSLALLALARVFRLCFSERAGHCALLFALTNLSVTYYGRATNMDGPYLMWTALAIDRLLLLAKSGRFADYVWFALFVALGVATKDQAYASFVITGPVYLVALPLLAAPTRAAASLFAAGRAHWRNLVRAMGLGALFYAAASGALVNPTGFLARVRMLTGSNSQDWKHYESDPTGWWENSRDLFASQADFWWPWPVVLLAWLGVVLIFWRAPQAKLQHWVWRALPLCAALSSLLAFTLVVGRTEHRFALPLGFWLSGYAGVAAAAVVDGSEQRLGRWASWALPSALLGLGFVQNFELLLTQWSDPRRDVERYLAELPAGSRVETYGLGVYLPRYDLGPGSHYSVTHVRGHLTQHGPYLPGMQNVVADYSKVAERRPDVLVIPNGFLKRFLEDPARNRQPARKAMQQYVNAEGAHEFFSAVAQDKLPGYTRLDVEKLKLPGWYTSLGGRAINVHGSTAESLWVLRRTESPSAPVFQ